ncbi:hypothetical protein [Cellulophaga baltica]|uniref:Uncharacterized protein n=1 Tax=Cellulophaga baltica 18 TaxID=1348584 RepID=A0AAU8RTC3_9FLAO|nr:hypothetical protein [Cellulophaga baltica]AIZ40845.1 hypothetical protein M666_04245 [Cellulophaga baltica 18]
MQLFKYLKPSNNHTFRPQKTGIAPKGQIVEDSRREFALEAQDSCNYNRTSAAINSPETDHINTGINVVNLN